VKPEARSRGSGSLPEGDRVSERLRGTIPDEVEALTDDGTGPGAPPRAHKLSPGEFNTAMIHFYRGEVQRSNTWRNRLDTTTNWAVLTAGATLSFAFSSPSNPHFVIPINSVLVAIFLVMEARRYRYYEVWSNRVRVMETGYFAPMLAPDDVIPVQGWSEHLANDLLTPHFTISEWEAIGRRLRRNYLWIFALLALSWNLKVYLHPTPARDFAEIVDRATIGIIPGWIILTLGVIFNAAVLIFAVATMRLREATGEVLPQHAFSLRTFGRMGLSRVAGGPRSTASRRAQKARRRVRTTSTLTGELKKAERTENEPAPPAPPAPEETVSL
jgi:uncharacterized membrane protein